MASNQTLQNKWLGAALMGLLTSCGGDGGNAGAGQPISQAPGPAPAPSPTPMPNPTPARAGATDKIIGAAAASQTFVGEGRNLFTDGGVSVSFDVVTGTYRTTDPANTTPGLLYRSSSYRPPDGQPWQVFVTEDGLNFLTRASAASTAPEYRYDYSNLAAWSFSTSLFGQTAFGIASPAGMGPSQSSASYSGFIEGHSTETYLSDGTTSKGGLKGRVALSFDPATGIAQITITPTLELARDYILSPITVTLNWSSGAAMFFQSVVGDTETKNYSITGRFTGPTAQELIGSISFGYASPLDGKPQLIGAAFIAKR